MRGELVALGVELLELDPAREDVVLPALVLGLAGVELGHDLPGDQLETLADVLVAGAAGLVGQDDLVHVRRLEPAHAPPAPLRPPAAARLEVPLALPGA